MNAEEERAAFVSLYLFDALEDIAHPFTFTREGWANMPVDDLDHLALGFLPPTLVEGRWFAFFCPEIIADQGWRPDVLPEQFAPLAKEQFDAYLVWVRMHMQLHVIHAAIADPVAREIEVAEQLARLDPMAAVVAARLHADVG